MRRIRAFSGGTRLADADQDLGPLVSYILAIEPDPRQAAALKNVARERVGAELTLVETNVAAIASIKQRLPDLILVTTLFSPREEEELISLLRSLDGAEHLQTLTIPLLATEDADDKPKRGLFRFGKKKKKAQPETRGCDPAVFAEQINGYLKTAADLRATAEAQRAFASVHGAPASAPAKAAGVGGDALADEIIYDTVAGEPVASDTSVADGSLYQSMFADQPVVEQRTPEPATTVEPSVASDTVYESLLVEARPSTFAEATADAPTLAEAPVNTPAAPRPPMFSFSAETLGELLERESKIESPARRSLGEGGPLGGPRRASLTDLPRPSLRSLIDAELSRTAESSPSSDSSDSPDPSPSIEPAPSFETPPAIEPSYAAEPLQEQEEPVAIVESAEAVESAALQEGARVFEPYPEPAIELDPEPEPVLEPVMLAPPPPPVRLVQRLPPLAMWARMQRLEPEKPRAKEPSATPVDTDDVLHGLRVPAHVLLVTYPQGCRIQRVRSVQSAIG
jgi:hypothetical protein